MAARKNEWDEKVRAMGDSFRDAIEEMPLDEVISSLDELVSIIRTRADVVYADCHNFDYFYRALCNSSRYLDDAVKFAAKVMTDDRDGVDLNRRP